jgi:tetratricopeptide (TPR) repeat protein
MSIDNSLRSVSGFSALILLCANLAGQTDNSREIQVLYTRAQEAMKANQLETAAQGFREVLRLDPNSAEARANLGLIAFKEGNYAEAAQSLQAALKLKPSLWTAQAFLGLAQDRLGHTAAAMPLLEESFKHLPKTQLRAQVGTDLIRIHQEANTLDQAVDIVRILRKSSPDDPDILYIAYRTYSDLAAQAVGALVHAAPDSARMHQIIAQACLSQDDFPGAIAQYRKALEIDPHLPGIHYELGRVVLANSQQEPARQEAEAAFESELAANPRDAYSEYELGEIYWLRSNHQLAFQHYSRASELRPDLVDAQIGLGKVLTAMGRPDEALPHLLEAVHLEPENDAAHYRLAQAYRRLGRSEDAEREQAAFQRLREAQGAVRSIYQQQLGQRPITNQTIDPHEPQ